MYLPNKNLNYDVIKLKDKKVLCINMAFYIRLTGKHQVLVIYFEVTNMFNNVLLIETQLPFYCSNSFEGDWGMSDFFQREKQTAVLSCRKRNKSIFGKQNWVLLSLRKWTKSNNNIRSKCRSNFYIKFPASFLKHVKRGAESTFITFIICPQNC